jgi:bacterioferritin
MRGNPEVLGLLAELLTNELTAINQYLLHASTCANWGYHRLAEKLGEESAGERQDADKLVERILFLDGTPDLMQLHEIRGGATVKEMLERDLEMEYAAIAALEAAIAKCRALGDNATEALLTEILVSEEHDAHWIESQLELIRQLGETNYLTQQL